MQAHLAVQGSQTRLRARVKELLGEVTSAQISSGGMTSVVAKVDELLEVDPCDARHMFWEEMRRLFFAMKEIEPEDLDEETMGDFLRAMDEVSKSSTVSKNGAGRDGSRLPSSPPNIFVKPLRAEPGAAGR